MKRANIISIVLLIYLAVLSALAYPTYQQSGDWTRYVLIIIGQLAIIYFLRYFSLKREQKRAEKQHNSDSKSAKNE